MGHIKPGALSGNRCTRFSLIRTFQINGQHGRLPRDIAHTTCNTLAITNGVYGSTSGGAAPVVVAPVVVAVASLTAVNVIVCGQPIKANGLRNPLARCSLSILTGHVAATMLPLPVQVPHCVATLIPSSICI